MIGVENPRRGAYSLRLVAQFAAALGVGEKAACASKGGSSVLQGT